MAWLARSIANTLKLDEEDEDNKTQQTESPRGVQEDISELTKTLRSQFWGVASFLSQPEKSNNHVEEEEDLISGIRNDIAEIGGRFKTGIRNLPVSEFTKIASSFLQLGSEEEEGDVIGVTEELVAFVKDLALHPETWLDFPLPNDEDNINEFEMTEAQYEHAVAVERFAPSLGSLRIELCPEYMSESCFWRVYFVLVHTKLSNEDALVLSTPQVLEARAKLSHELRVENKAPVQGESSDATVAIVQHLAVPDHPSPESKIVESVAPNDLLDFETDKHTIESKEIEVVDKSVIKERNTSVASSSTVIKVQVEDEEEDDADDWLNDDDETSESVSGVERGATTKYPIGEDEEDVSFSDLEEDDEEGDVPVSDKKVTNSDSPDWVQLPRPVK